MKVNYRLIIFALVVLAVGAIFAIPYLSPESKEFTVTPEPVKKLAQAAADGRPVFLEFYSAQWPACREMEPVVLALKNKYNSKMEFITANTTTPEGSSLARKFDIYYIPVFFILDREGKILDRIEFPQVQDNPQQTLDALISGDLQKMGELQGKGR